MTRSTQIMRDRIPYNDVAMGKVPEVGRKRRSIERTRLAGQLFA